MRKFQQYLLVISACLYLAFILGSSFLVEEERFFTLVDDAMISMRYGRNLANGNGLVWNAGEPPIQGFTNPGWTFVMAFVHVFPIEPSKVSLTIMLISLAILLGNILVTGSIAEYFNPGSNHAPALSMILTAFYFPLVFWSLRGMEVGLLVLLLNGALLLTLSERNPCLVGLLLSLAVIVRLDACIGAVGIAVYSIARYRSRKALLPILGIAVTIAAILLFQKNYFGDMLPTTYYQKVAGYTIWERMQRGILAFIEFNLRDTLFLFLFSVLGLIHYRQSRKPELLLLIGLFLAQCAYSISIGGDYAEPETNSANRFITLGMPPLLMLFSLMADRLLTDLENARSKKPPSTRILIPTIAFGLASLMIVSGEPWLDYAINNAPLLKADIRRVKIGLHIAKHTSPEAMIAVHAAGQIPYYSQRRTIDLLGLNDPIVARGPAMGEFYPGHNKWNYEYSIGELKPDVIADNFAPFGDYIRANPEYQQLESDMYARFDSTLIDIEALNADYQ
ncbi:MAG: DUF2029 domain-containing protein [Chloroflexi bacterium]|nr:DUF2029 domain-containing protein [Chloroflexota bacterium]